MHLSNIYLLFGAFTSLATAQYQNTSDPFNLVVRSTNATLDGSVLYALHEGAAIESLGPYGEKTTIGNASLPTFLFNYSAPTGGNDTDTDGYLLWPLAFNSGSGESQILEGLQLGAVVNPISNVVTPLFYPSDTGLQTVSFDECGKLYISGYIDDTIDPFQYPTHATKYYRWYICTTYAGYLYQTLAWTLGNAPPENPTCQKVDVQRLFVGQKAY